MASGQYNTMAEGLNKMNQECASLMATPDADLDFLTQLQTMILQKLRQPIEQQLPAAGGAGGGGGMPPELAAMMGGGGGGPTGITPAGGPPPGSMPMPSAPMPGGDELQRLMSGTPSGAGMQR